MSAAKCVCTDVIVKQVVPGGTQTKLNVGTLIKKGKKELKKDGDFHLLKFIVCCSVAPSVIDSPFFKDFVTTIQPKYVPASSTALHDSLVPKEAAWIQAKNVKAWIKSGTIL